MLTKLKRKEAFVMKKSFKALAVLLSVIMLCASISVAGFAAQKEQYCPTIVIPGLFQCEVKYYDENGEVALNSNGEPYEAPFFLETEEKIIVDALTEALVPVGSLLINQKDKDEAAAQAIADVVARVLMEKSACDENGDFIYDIRATKYDTSVAELSDYDREYVYNALPLQNYTDIVGEENLYIFSYASLGNMMKTASELYDFIKEVKAKSPTGKVNIAPISQGGSIANALLQMYAENNESLADDINRIVYIVPALDGSSLLGDIFEFGFLDDDEELYKKMFPALMGDDYSAYLINIILRIFPNADLNNILDKTVDVLVRDYMSYSTLLWGLIPSGNYPGCRELYLKDEAHSEILRQTDWFYEAQLNSDANILKAVADGVEVFDIVDYNEYLYELCDSWDTVNADGIIQLDSTSMGAYSLGVDVQLPAEYETPAELNHCTDPEHHDHSDPNNIVDPCTGLLPETTFYFCNQNHEKTSSNDIIMKLAAALLSDDNFKDVYTYPDCFPQFNYGRNSKSFMKDVESFKSFDTSALSPELKAEYDSVMAQSVAALDNTVMNPDDFEQAKAEFYTMRERVKTYAETGALPSTEKPADSAFDIDSVLTKLLKLASDILYFLFEGLGFSEMK